MWNTALIFSNKNHGLQKKTSEKKPFFYCWLCKNYWITYCTHITSHAVWVDEIADVMMSIKKINKIYNIFFLKNFNIIFHFQSLSVFILTQNIGRSIPLKHNMGQIILYFDQTLWETLENAAQIEKQALY